MLSSSSFSNRSERCFLTITLEICTSFLRTSTSSTPLDVSGRCARAGPTGHNGPNGAKRWEDIQWGKLKVAARGRAFASVENPGSGLSCKAERRTKWLCALLFRTHPLAGWVCKALFSFNQKGLPETQEFCLKLVHFWEKESKPSCFSSPAFSLRDSDTVLMVNR